MLTDPQSRTIAGTAYTLPKLEQRTDTSVYSDVANAVDLFVTQKVARDGRRRATSTLQKSIIITDPVTGIKSKVPYSVSIGISVPLGIPAADVIALYTAETAALSASTNALLTKVVGGER
jgi:hypothetical protein